MRYVRAVVAGLATSLLVACAGPRTLPADAPIPLQAETTVPAPPGRDEIAVADAAAADGATAEWGSPAPRGRVEAEERVARATDPDVAVRAMERVAELEACRYFAPTGSRIKRWVCYTRTDLEREGANSREVVEQARRGGRGPWPVFPL